MTASHSDSMGGGGRATGGPSTEHQEFIASVRAVLTKHAGSAAVRAAMDTELGYDETLWRLLCEQVGVAALAIPEEYGGFGASLVESLLVVTELGRTLAGVPMLGSAVLGAQAVLLSGDNEACERLLPEVAEGARTIAVCWAGTGGWDEPGVHSEAGTLSGTAHYVLDGLHADTLVVVTSTDCSRSSRVPRASPGALSRPWIRLASSPKSHLRRFRRGGSLRRIRRSPPGYTKSLGPQWLPSRSVPRSGASR